MVTQAKVPVIGLAYNGEAISTIRIIGMIITTYSCLYMIQVIHA